jgi:nucleotide-binding universal stress UspA family protein
MKSILLHIYDDTALESRLQAAFDLARAGSGHISCVHATPYEDYLATDPLVAAALPEEFSRKMKRLVLELRERVEARMRAEGVSWDWIHVNSLISDALVRFSALNDIVIVSQAGAALMRDDPRPIAASVATAARAPVLVVPQTLERLDLAAPMLVAWNASPEAAVALRWATPLLQMASSVHIAIASDRLTPYPYDGAARYLARHGIEAEILQRPVEDGIGTTIVGAARELGAGLVVMGAYGHSRLREFILGGTTRELLQDAPLPLLLAH